MTDDQRRQRQFAIAYLVAVFAILLSIVLGPKGHPSTGWIVFDVAIGALLLAILLGGLFTARQRVRRDGSSKTFNRQAFRRSALMPVLVIVVAAFIAQRFIG